MTEADKIFASIKAELRKEIKAEILNELKENRRGVSSWDGVKEIILDSSFNGSHIADIYQIFSSFSVLIRETFGVRNVAHLTSYQIELAKVVVQRTIDELENARELDRKRKGEV